MQGKLQVRLERALSLMVLPWITIATMAMNNFDAAIRPQVAPEFGRCFRAKATLFITEARPAPKAAPPAQAMARVPGRDKKSLVSIAVVGADREIDDELRRLARSGSTVELIAHESASMRGTPRGMNDFPELANAPIVADVEWHMEHRLVVLWVK